MPLTMLPMAPLTTILLHGFAGAPSAWDPVLENASIHKHTHTPSFLIPWLPGHGPEGKLLEDDFFFTIKHFLDNLRVRLDAHSRTQNGSQFNLVGYSMGARVALAYALSCPAKIASLTLIGCHPGLQDESKDTKRAESVNREQKAERIQKDLRWADIIEQQGIEEFVNLWEELPIFASQKKMPQAIFNTQRKIRLGHNPRALASAMSVLGLGLMPNLWSQLPSLICPVTLVVGEYDEKFQRIAEEMRLLLQNSYLVIIPDSGHNPLLEQPKTLAKKLFS